MKREKVKIKSHEYLNHNVLQITTEKPDGYQFTSGQALMS